MVLNNGAFHKAAKLDIPENIILIFLPTSSFFARIKPR
jgi:hypothetical protein